MFQHGVMYSGSRMKIPPVKASQAAFSGKMFGMKHQDMPRTVADVFSLAIEVEAKAGKLYGELVKLFAHEPAVSAFWTSLRDDEAEHAAMLQDALAELPPEKVASDADPAIWIKLVDMNRRLDRCSPEEFETLDDAYEVAHELEYSEVSGIFSLLASGMCSKLTSMAIIEMNIDRHQSKLIEFTHAFGGRAWRQTIHVQRC